MLGTLLDKLGSLFSKYFIVGSFVPVLWFAFLNTIILKWSAPWILSFNQFTNTNTSEVTLGGVVAVGLAILAYLLSSISNLLRELLEGKYVAWVLPSRLFGIYQKERRKKLWEDYMRAQQNREQLHGRRSRWRVTLTQARGRGEANDDPGDVLTYSDDNNCHRQIEQLESKLGLEDISPGEIEYAATLLVGCLERNYRTPDTNGADKLRLDADLHTLLVVIDSAIDYWCAVELRCFNEKRFQFGEGEVASTAMGNVALSIENYAYSRYGLNLENFWSRFQPTLEAHKEFYSSLLDAKTQLEFLVACYWLSILTTCIWIILFLAKGYAITPFVVIAIAGPLLSTVFHRLAVQNYLVYADLIRSSVDLYRLDLLRSLHVSPPRSLREERAKWKALERISVVGQQEQEISYREENAKGGATG